MNISMENIVTWIVMAVGLIGMWFKNQAKVERLTEKDNEQGLEIKDFWSWKNKHEKEANDNRERFNSQISELKGSLLVTGEQFKQIMSSLQDLKERMIKLENK